MAKGKTTSLTKSSMEREKQASYWSIITAYGLAAAEGIKLTDEHFEVIKLLRDDYADFGYPVNQRQLFTRLELIFANRGGSQFLYKLFPRDPVEQALRIAGLSQISKTQFAFSGNEA